MLGRVPEALLDTLVSIAQATVLRPVFVLAVACILLWERLAPADEEQPTFSVGFLNDGVWVVLGLAFQATAVVAYAHMLKQAYDANLGWLRVQSIAQLPEGVRLVLGVVVSDLLGWFQHWVKHKVPWFWQLHAVHHSQRQLNLFTDFRFHYGEYLISRPIVMLPLLVLGISAPSFLLYNLFATWQTRFYHANIRTNLGPLRFIFVTPQSHRVHHSIETRHRDTNFGVMFSFWDRLFGTQSASADEYPRTGIEDPAFPMERRASPLGLLVVPFKQLVYPFVAIARGIRRA
jgi:sterol desaturase/sphingolipid hydroxylase (fatty acid hydroxylase superfamily)